MFIDSGLSLPPKCIAPGEKIPHVKKALVNVLPSTPPLTQVPMCTGEKRVAMQAHAMQTPLDMELGYVAKQRHGAPL